MPAFHQIDLKEIQDYLIFLDIDGTLIHDNHHELDEDMIRKTSTLKEKNEVYLCSNSRNHERNRKVAELTGIPYLETDLRKPDQKILELIPDPKKKKLVIGDKFLTDGLFAKAIKADFIKVERLTSEHDSPYIKFLYWTDDLISKILPS